MGAYKYYNPSTGKWEIIKSKSIIKSDGSLEYTPDDIKEIDDKIDILSSDVVSHKAQNITAHNVSRGISNFAGDNQEVTIPHGLSATPTSAYAFPTINPEGYLGEVWIRMDETNLYVGNSGSFIGQMSWTAIG